jgi:hypothetical protein
MDLNLVRSAPDEPIAISGPGEPPSYSPRPHEKPRLSGPLPHLPSEALWPADIHPQDENDLGPGEEAVGTFRLASPRLQTLDVIRSADRVFRLVLTEESPGRIKEAKTEVALNTRNDTFIPLHTIIPLHTVSGHSDGSSFPVETITGYGTRTLFFNLKERKDAHAFQRACTNYNVASFKQSVKLAIACLGRRLRRLGPVEHDLGSGEIQLWQWPNTQLPPEEKLGPSQAFNRVSNALAETLGLSKWSMASRTSSSRRLVSGVITVMGNEENELAVAATLPPPLLVAFVEQRRKPASKVTYTMYKVDGMAQPDDTNICLTRYSFCAQVF